ncbi:MAG: hypothetical protein KDB36_14215 [Acidimicrobiales bacterium]|nr:hypothetical protein [Acidimicrobiales bacterium]
MPRARDRLVRLGAAGIAVAGGVVAVERYRRQSVGGSGHGAGTAATTRAAAVPSAPVLPARGSVEAVRAAVLRPVEVARPALDVVRAQRLARLGRVSEAVMGLLAVLITLLLREAPPSTEPDDPVDEMRGEPSAAPTVD